MQHLKKLEPLLKHILSDEFKYEEREEKQRDWRLYNEHQVRELTLFLSEIKERVDGVKLPKIYQHPDGGRPGASAHDLAKLIIFQQHLQLSLRAAASWVPIIRGFLGIESVDISFMTLSNAYGRADVRFILQEVFNSIAREDTKETIFAGDFSGKSTSVKAPSWADDKTDHKKCKLYDKFGGIMGVESGILKTFVVTRGTANDCPLLQPQLEDFKERAPDAQALLLDAGFVSRENAQAIADVGVAPYIYPKKGLKLNPKGCHAWRNMYLDLLYRPQRWLSVYHLRSNYESGNNSFKCQVGRVSRTRCEERRQVELYAEACCYNLTKWIRWKYRTEKAG